MNPRPLGAGGGRFVRAALLGLVIAWCAAPVLAYSAAATKAPLLGGDATDESSTDLVTWLAAACGLLAPAVGLAIGIKTRQQSVALAFAILLLISLSGLIVIVLIT